MILRKTISLLLGALCMAGSSAAQTYYYERVAEVINGTRTAASGDGHFITFTRTGCYDSDREGYTEQNGFVEYKTTANNIRCYYGSSYFGRAYYYFSMDYSRLNIKRESDGTVYVYARKNAPDHTTAAMRKKGAASGTPSAVPYMPPEPDLSGGSSTTTASRRTCPSCRGTGRGQSEIHYQTNFTGKGNARYCAECGKVMAAHTHIHHICTVCAGKGYIN